MNRLQLATLLSWAGDSGLQGRKRLQKVVFLLQQAGCPLDCRFVLHHFGPYSRDVAAACDEIVAAGLVDETGGPATGEMQYSYTLKPATRTLLEQTPDSQMELFEGLGRQLISTEIWPLELGSTILFFYGQTGDWDEALAHACKFKKVPAEITASQNALALVKQVQRERVN
jgi:uncharacterized protein YwgA